MREVRIDEILNAGNEPVFSFEFFPPKTPEGEANLYAAIEQLQAARPGLRLGDLRRRRLDARQDAGDRLAHPRRARPRGDGALHLRRGDGRGAARDARRDGAAWASTTCSRCAATRRAGEEQWTKTEGGLEYSSELVELIRGDYGFCDRRARLPRDAHPRDRAPRTTCATSRRKVDAGVDFLITQLFFDNDALLRLRRASARASGHRGADHPRDPADHERRPARSGSPRCAARSIPDGLRRDLDRAPTTRRRSRSSASPTRRCSARELLARRRARDPLLHAEPLAGDARDPQRAEAAAPVGLAAGAGRPAAAAPDPLSSVVADLEALGDRRHAVGRVQRTSTESSWR